MEPIYFVSSNAQKYEDLKYAFRGSAHTPRWLRQELVEVLSSDLKTVVTEKAKAAYRAEPVPLIVEHGALYIDALNGFPGPMVKLFWEKLDAKLPKLIPPGASRRASVVQMVCYFDGKKLRLFDGVVDGEIAPEKRGSYGMHWEPLFIPDGQSKTFGEMTADERNATHGVAKAHLALRRELGI